MKKYMQNHEKKFSEAHRIPDINSFTQLFRKESNPEDFELFWSKPSVKLFVRDSGTSFDSNLPCVKAEFTFDPVHNLQEVFEAI